MEFLALLSSMPFESNKILSQLKNIRRTKIAGKTVCTGKLLNTGILLMNTGIGKVNAAHSATGIIEKFPVRGIINLGVGGAYPESGLKVGDIAVALREIYGDEGVISLKGRDRPAYRTGRLVPSWKNLKSIGIPLVQTGRKKYFNEFPLDKKIAQKVLDSIPPNPPQLSCLPLPQLLSSDRKTQGQDVAAGESKKRGCRVKSGNFITVSSTTGTHKRAVELKKRFNAICENMEGAAIAQVCAIYKIPMLEIRGISNIAGIRDKRKWNLKLASENCQKAVLGIISSI